MNAFDYDREGYVAEVENSIGFIGQDLDFFTEAKARNLIDIAGRRLGPPEGLRVLDVGCGVGLLDEQIVGAFGQVVGADSSIVELKTAKDRTPEASYAGADGGNLPFADATFDVVVAVCVIHHVPVDSWNAFLDELQRVTRAGGLVVVIEHNPLNPLTRLAVSRCSFDEDAVLLGRGRVKKLMRQSELRVAEARYILFFPWRARFWRRIEPALRGLPLGAQHLTVGMKSGAK